MRYWNNPKGLRPHRFRPHVSTSLSSIARDRSVKAIYEFTKAIPTGEAETPESPGQTLESYVSMLTDWDRERTLSDADVPGEGDGAETSTIKDDRRQKHAERGDND